jgi:hypothetical protein
LKLLIHIVKRMCDLGGSFEAGSVQDPLERRTIGQVQLVSRFWLRQTFAGGFDAGPPRASFGHVTTWVFDLDNTLYPAGSGIWSMLNDRITLFLVDLFGLDGESARALHRYYYM